MKNVILIKLMYKFVSVDINVYRKIENEGSRNVLEKEYKSFSNNIQNLNINKNYLVTGYINNI